MLKKSVLAVLLFGTIGAAQVNIEKDEPRVFSAHCTQPQRLRNKLDAPEGF
jgi:hypothetical protein